MPQPSTLKQILLVAVLSGAAVVARSQEYQWPTVRPAGWQEEEESSKLPAKKPPKPAELPSPKQDPTEALIEAGVLPPASSEPAMPAVPTTPEYMYDTRSQGAFDAVGTFDDPNTIGPRNRPLYPYGHNDYWYGHDANVEEWTDLMELPHVRLGWFADVDVTAFKPKVRGTFNSQTFLDGTFPGNPVSLGPGTMDWSLMPKIELGYRYEHGLGDLRMSYRRFDASGTDPIAGFDSSGVGTQNTSVKINIIDLDFFGSLEFNAESMPVIMTLLKSPFRWGLGKPTVRNRLVPPLEMRWFFGFRYANLAYDTVGHGDLLLEHVHERFEGAGVHFGIDLNERLPTEAPLFLHARAEGSGIYGLMSQQFTRQVAGGAGATGGFSNDGIGVPTVTLELGVAWVPNWPNRDIRATLAYQYEEWFSWAQVGSTNADLFSNGILLRGEYKF
jgi:hypothetical protein